MAILLIVCILFLLFFCPFFLEHFLSDSPIIRMTKTTNWISCTNRSHISIILMDESSGSLLAIPPKIWMWLQHSFHKLSKDFTLTIDGVCDQVSGQSYHDWGLKMIWVNEKCDFRSNNQAESRNEHREDIRPREPFKCYDHSHLSPIVECLQRYFSDIVFFLSLGLEVIDVISHQSQVISE